MIQNKETYQYDALFEEYHPFGTTSYRSRRTETEVSLKRYKYVGKERDEETGLYYYGARYYSAWLCRFVSVDPLAGNAPGWSPYNAMWNNPILNIDPDGRWAGDYYKTGKNGKVTYSHSDENKRDGKVYLDGKQLPSFSIRQTLKGKIDAHLSNGPTFDEIGGKYIPIVEYDENDFSAPGVSKNVLVDAIPSKPFLSPDKGGVDGGDVLIDINSGNYESPKGYYADKKTPIFTWHLHPSGAYVQVDGMWKPILDNKIPLYPNSSVFNTTKGPTLGADKGHYKNSLEFTFEPKNQNVYTTDHSENTSKSSFQWFFNVKEGTH